ncbi:MAG: hypothetical protein GVY31_01895 [Alphaproteobacteria bacterium]|jgi:microcystin degradation protein MlrC|nr:hypothetical protein [Alphaproteobacteria bacterium]
MSKPRIAVLGMSHETMLASPASLEWTDITIRRSWDVAGRADTTGGMIEYLTQAGAEVLPLMFVGCQPGGPMPQEIHGALKKELLSRLAAELPVDGICLALHGAMEVPGLQTSADTDFVLSVRNLVGRDVPIAVGMDMHGHVTPEGVHSVDAWSGFRTAPHRDAAETGAAAAAQLLSVISKTRSPCTAAVRIPLLLPGECAMTDSDPTRSLFEMLPEIEAEHGVLGAMLLVGFAWNDVPWGGMAALVTHEDDADRAAVLACDLARAVWSRRHEFAFGVPTCGLADGLEIAARADEHPLYLSDTGDNVTAGAFGDSTNVLREVLARSDLSDVVVLGITAPTAVARCMDKPAGTVVTLTLGDDHIAQPPAPFTADATIAGTGQLDGSDWVKLKIAHVTVTLHAHRRMITTVDHIRALGIDPRQHAVYVVKLGYLHPEIEDVAARSLLLLTDGTANLDLGHVAYEVLPRPAFPLDPKMKWTPCPVIRDSTGGTKRTGSI